MALPFEKKLFGLKPEVPPLEFKDIGQIQKKTIRENIEATPDVERLATEYNRFGMQELAKALEFVLPGGRERAQRNINAQLEGIMPVEDTQALIRNATAAGWGKGLFRHGFGGSGRLGVGGNLTLRDLGLGVMETKQRGLQNFATLAGLATPKQFDFSSMFFTPQDRLKIEDYRTEQLWNREWLFQQIENAPDPAGVFTTQLVLSAAGSLGSAAGAGAGGAGACFVAREVYGETNPKWRLFRAWLYEDAPAWFRSLYVTFGEAFAALIRPFPRVKASIRRWMDSKIALKYGD